MNKLFPVRANPFTAKDNGDVVFRWAFLGMMAIITLLIVSFAITTLIL